MTWRPQPLTDCVLAEGEVHTLSGSESEVGVESVLARIPDEWIQLLPLREQVGDEHGRRVGITILMLRQKGIVENELRPAEPRREPWIRRQPGAVFTTEEAASG